MMIALEKIWNWKLQILGIESSLHFIIIMVYYSYNYLMKEEVDIVKTKITYAGKEVTLKEMDIKSNDDRHKINNATLERAKKILTLLREDIGK